MSGQELGTPSIFSRAMGVLRSRRLKRFTGTDLTVIERKVTDYPQLLLKVTLGTALLEFFSWFLAPNRLTFLDPQIGEATSDADDQDAVWLTNPVKIARLLRNSGFQILSNVPSQSLVIARKR